MYEILDPAAGSDPRFHGLCALAVMAKAPRPGHVKTRLSPPLTSSQAADLNVCFLQDTTRNLTEVAASTHLAAGLISYTPVGQEALFNDLLPSSFYLLPQRGEGFGERLLATAEDALSKGFSSVCLIDSDSPTVPAAAFTQAILALHQPGDRVVLGPSVDGGYYLIGLKLPHPEPFTGISWSSPQVADQTRAQCRSAGIELLELPLWYDVDDAETLNLLTSELLSGTSPSFAALPGYPAENTALFLASQLLPTPTLAASAEPSTP